MKPQQFEKAMKGAVRDLTAPKQLMTDIGLIAVGNTQRIAPVLTGTYRRSITSRVEGNAAYIGSALVYAPPLEYGTKFMAAQAPIGTGIQNSISEIQRKAAEYGQKVFEKVGRG